ncbi:MAG: methyltransferase [Bdellovibrionaceae bacterium]|nr:methyltransferase [Pseudobdellovibrionaceae bacterium]
MLTVIATPIGDLDEITIKALRKLSEAQIIVCESTKETSKLLRHHGIAGKIYEVLDEHSTKDDLTRLTSLCREKNVALVSDCGTPGFCDPGSDLVESCRKDGITIENCLGASSLMGLISLSGVKLQDFLFRGFVPQETAARAAAYKEIQNEFKQRKRPVVLMDTPYRLQKMIDEVVLNFSECHVVLATDLGTVNQQVLTGSPAHVKQNLKKTKAEFMILVKPR